MTEELISFASKQDMVAKSIHGGTDEVQAEASAVLGALGSGEGSACSAGRIYLSGPTAHVGRAQREITEVLSAVAGRDHVAGREP